MVRNGCVTVWAALCHSRESGNPGVTLDARFRGHDGVGIWSGTGIPPQVSRAHSYLTGRVDAQPRTCKDTEQPQPTAIAAGYVPTC